MVIGMVFGCDMVLYSDGMVYGCDMVLYSDGMVSGYDNWHGIVMVLYLSMIWYSE